MIANMGGNVQCTVINQMAQPLLRWDIPRLKVLCSSGITVYIENIKQCVGPLAFVAAAQSFVSRYFILI